MSLPPDLVQSIRDYTDSAGLLQNIITPYGTVASGNGILVTGIACALLARLGELAPFRDGFDRALSICEPEPGLLVRHPLMPEDQEAGDDYIGAGAASFFLQSEIAKRIVTRGENPKPGEFDFYFKNSPGTDFDARAWIGRFPGAVTHLKFAAYQVPPLFDRIVQALIVAFQPWKNEDEPTLSWLMIEVAKPRSISMQLAAIWFYFRLFRKYPDGMVGVFTKTYGPTHPISLLAGQFTSCI